MGVVMRSELEAIRAKYPWFISHVLGAGLAWAIHVNIQYKPLLKDILRKFLANGLLLISPGGVRGTTFKLVPPLIIDEEGIREGCAIVDRSIAEIISEFQLTADAGHA